MTKELFSLNHDVWIEIIMTTSPPSLSLSHRPSQQRLHDPYDYDASAATRTPYHFATSPAIPSYSPLNTISKPLRSALPTVCPCSFSRILSHLPSSNGSIIILQTVDPCLLTIIRISHPLAVLLLWLTFLLLLLPQQHQVRSRMKKSFQQPLSLKIYHLT